jgi:putative transcriptional regulator
MTQDELAGRVGCTMQTIIALEQGKYVPSLELAFRVARAFKVPWKKCSNTSEHRANLYRPSLFVIEGKPKSVPHACWSLALAPGIGHMPSHDSKANRPGL